MRSWHDLEWQRQAEVIRRKWWHTDCADCPDAGMRSGGNVECKRHGVWTNLIGLHMCLDTHDAEMAEYNAALDAYLESDYQPKLWEEL